MYRILAAGLIVAGLASSASAQEREVTAEERAAIEKALDAQGCSGGEMEFDGGIFEVEDATCDGKDYNVRLDSTFKVLSKERSGWF